MNQSNQTNTKNRWTVSNSVPTTRRRVVQGIAALGLGSGVLGSARATNNQSAPAQSSKRGETPTAIQLWTIQALVLSTAEEIHMVADAGYDAVEFHTLDDPDEVENALDETGLDVAGAHVGLDELENDFEETVETYTQVGTDTFVIPAADDEFFQSEDGVDELSQRFNALADQLEDQGLKFGFHNHHTEFVELNGRTAFDLLVEKTSDSVRFQIENLAAVAGENPVSLIAQIGDRVDSVHMRDLHENVPEEDAAYYVDGVGWDFAEIGEGDINMDSVATVAQAAADVDWLIYEHNPADPENYTIETGAEVLSTMNSLGNSPR